MDMEHAGYLVAELRCEKREGSFHIFSDDIPGFHLAVGDIAGIDEDVLSAVEWFFKNTKGWDIRAEKAASPLAVMGKRAANDEHRIVMTRSFAFA